MDKSVVIRGREGGEQSDDVAKELTVRIEAFLSHKSRNTQRTYQGILSEWIAFLERFSPGQDPARRFVTATDLHASAYRQWLLEQPGQAPRMQRSPARGDTKASLPSTARRERSNDGLQTTLANATIAKKFAALRRVYRMLMAHDFSIRHNPFDTDRVPPPAAKSGQKRPTEMIAFSKVRDILDLPDASTPKGIRDRAILAALFGGGLRRSEAVRLRIGDVRRSSTGTSYLYLRSTKARRDAEQALPDWATEPIWELVTLRKKQGANEGDYLFVSFRGPGGRYGTEKPLSDNGLYRLFKRYCSLAGVPDFVSPHSARATAITKLLSDGVPHREVQEFSRHASVQMVEAYDKRRLGVDQNPGRSLRFSDE